MVWPVSSASAPISEYFGKTFNAAVGNRSARSLSQEKALLTLMPCALTWFSVRHRALRRHAYGRGFWSAHEHRLQPTLRRRGQQRPTNTVCAGRDKLRPVINDLAMSSWEMLDSSGCFDQPENSKLPCVIADQKRTLALARSGTYFDDNAERR